MNNLKVLLKTMGYGFGALFVLAGLTGSASSVAFGLGLLTLTLLASNAWGLRARFPHFNAPGALHRGAAYAGLIIATLLATAMLAPQTPEQRRAAVQAPARANAQATAQAHAQAAQARAAATQAARVAPIQTAQARVQAAHAQATAAAQAAAARAATAAAQAAQRRQQQADFRTFYGKALGVTNECSDAHKTATQDLTAITNGSGDDVTAYQDAQSAADTCGQVSISLPSVPDDLQGFKLDQATTDLSYWAVGEQQAWQDMQKVLNDQGQVASAADFKSKLQAAQDEQLAGVALFVGAAQDLGVDVRGVQPIAPGS